MRNTVVDLGLVRVGLVVGLRDAFGDDFPVATLVACKLAVSTLHASRVLEQFSAEGAAHDVVELLLDELVAILLVDFFFSLTDGSLTTKSVVECLLSFVLLDWFLLDFITKEAPNILKPSVN
jgi:phosphatidylglycerophosphatase A